MQVWRVLILVAVTGLCRTAAGKTTATGTNTVVVSPAFIGALIKEMRTNHPALLAANSRTNAAAAGVGAIRTWEDSMVRFGAMTAEEMMRADDGDVFYGVEQKLPLWGKPALARRIAQAELAVETANAEYQFQVLKSEFARAAFRAALADQTAVISEQDSGWLQTLAEAMDAKFQSGQATLVEALLVQNERARRNNQLQTDRSTLTQTRVRMNRLLNRSLESPWPTFDLPPVAGPVYFNQQLVSFAMKYEPKLRTLREQVKQAEATVKSTRRSRLPDVSLGAESRNYSGNGEWRQAEFMLNFSLPLFNKNKYSAELRRDEAKLQASAFEAADYELSLQEEVHALTVKIDAARREALLYRDDIIPRTTSALDSARASWESGRGSFREVLDTRRMLLEGRVMYARAVSEQYQMLSELVLCCGLGDLEALQMIGAIPDRPTEANQP